MWFDCAYQPPDVGIMFLNSLLPTPSYANRAIAKSRIKLVLDHR